MNKKQSLPCRSWCHGLLFFLRLILRFVLLLLLHHSGKLVIPRDHLSLLLQIFHLIHFNSLQFQGKLSISGDSFGVFWWDIDGNYGLSSLRRVNLQFVQNGFITIYFWPTLVRHFRKVVSWCCNNAEMIALLSVAGQHLLRYWAVPLTSLMVWNIHVNVINDLCFTLFCELVGWPTISKSQALEIVYRAHARAVEGVVFEGKSVSWGGAWTKGELNKCKLKN